MQKTNLKYYLISLFIIDADQISKYLIRYKLSDFENVPFQVIGDFFRIRFVQNPGAAFSLYFNSSLLNKLLFLYMPIALILFFIYLIATSKNRLSLFSYSLILGGAIGNIIDRIIFGKVTDFLDFDFPDFLIERWPTFNIADSSIVVAMILILLADLVFTKKNTINSETTEEE
ncbi:MAG: signal peptidase II [Candidatus Cloacimonetes bacterium]|nr:signal peptidase II [Candidatus Cloacimonadota bacterium]